MDELIKQYTNPFFWINLLIVTVIAELIVRYLLRKYDATASKLSSWYRSKSEKRKADWENRVQAIKQNPEYKMHEANTEFRQRLSSIHMLLLAIMFLVIPQFEMFIKSPETTLIIKGLLNAFPYLLLFASFKLHGAAEETRRALFEATKSASN